MTYEEALEKARKEADGYANVKTRYPSYQWSEQWMEYFYNETPGFAFTMSFKMCSPEKYEYGIQLFAQEIFLRNTSLGKAMSEENE